MASESSSAVRSGARFSSPWNRSCHAARLVASISRLNPPAESRKCSPLSRCSLTMPPAAVLGRLASQRSAPHSARTASIAASRRATFEALSHSPPVGLDPRSRPRPPPTDQLGRDWPVPDRDSARSCRVRHPSSPGWVSERWARLRWRSVPQKGAASLPRSRRPAAGRRCLAGWCCRRPGRRWRRPPGCRRCGWRRRCTGRPCRCRCRRSRCC